MPEVQPVTSPSPAASSHPYRIAVVVSHPAESEVLSRLLELGGHEVRSANDGLEGVDLVKSFRPDIVLSSIELSGLNGFDVASKIRESFSTKPLLIAYTSYSRQEIGEKAKASGFDFLILKPAPPREFSLVFTSLEGSRECEEWRL